MTNHKPSFAASPSPLRDKSKGGKEIDAGSALEDASLEGVLVTDDELAELVKELGLEGDAAGDLVKGLSFTKDTETKEAEGSKDKESSEKHSKNAEQGDKE